MEDVDLDQYRSVQCHHKAYVRFYNKTESPVELIWINYLGQYRKYRVLLKDQYVDINTFKTHPWLALNQQTKQRLHINKTFVYYPRTSKEVLQERRPDLEIPENYELRVKAYITLPMYSLRYKAILEISNCIPEPNAVDVLQLPEILANELKIAIRHKNSLSGVPFIS